MQNSGGRILHVGTGNFGLSAAHVTGAGGDLSTNGLLTLTADNWTNSDVLQAGQLVLNIGNFTQTASGKLLSGNSFTGSGGNWTNHGLLASDGNFSLNLSGAYTGNGQATSLGELTVKAASIDLSNSARIAGGGPTQVSATGVFNNLGKLTSASDLTVSANTLNNRGTLGSGEKLRLVAPTLLNENGLIFSGDDMALRVNSLTNKFADVYSLGELTVAANDQLARANVVENISATIESAEDMSIRANALTNAKDQFSTDLKFYSGVVNLTATDNCKGKHCWAQYNVSEVYQAVAAQDSASANIFAGNNFTFEGDDLTNKYSTVAAGRNINIASVTLRMV